MSRLSRRGFLMFSLLGTQALMTACGGGGSDSSAQATALSSSGTSPIVPAAPAPAPAPAAAPTPPAPAPAPAPAWDMRRTLALLVGATSTVDLKPTLPAGVAAGGRFEIDTSGTPLPAGVHLSADGILSVDASARPGAVQGLVFAYIEP